MLWFPGACWSKAARPAQRRRDWTCLVVFPPFAWGFLVARETEFRKWPIRARCGDDALGFREIVSFENENSENTAAAGGARAPKFDAVMRKTSKAAARLCDSSDTRLEFCTAAVQNRSFSPKWKDKLN